MGWEGASFGDVQLRAYLKDLSSQEILAKISEPALATATGVSWEKGRPARTTTGTEGRWRTALIQYELFYGDYGGTASVRFYITPAGPHELVMVFMALMGGREKEIQEMLDSVSVPNPLPASGPP